MRMPKKVVLGLKNTKTAHIAFILFMYSRVMQVWESGNTIDIKWNIWNPIGLFMWVFLAIVIFISGGTQKFKRYGETNGLFLSDYWKENERNFLVPTKKGLYWESEL